MNEYVFFSFIIVEEKKKSSHIKSSYSITQFMDNLYK